MFCLFLGCSLVRCKAPALGMQRRIVENADARTRKPKGDDRVESGCVVCARRFWSDELKPVVLFQDPSGKVPGPDSSIDQVRANQQERLCRLLGIRRYQRRWPHIDLQALRKAAVEHPYLSGEFLLLHRRRMPSDYTDPCMVCAACRGSLLASVLSLPRHSLANDLWIGPQLPSLSNLTSATRRLLPMVRPCLQVVVLQPQHLQRIEKQRGLIGNSIFLPQARPSAVQQVLPPRDADMQDSILFVLVGGQKSQVKGSSLLKAPRDEYEAAVQCLQKTSPYYASVHLQHRPDDVLDGCVLETAEDSALAQELLQKGPADAQGQEDSDGEDAPGGDAASSKDPQEGGGCLLFYRWVWLDVSKMVVLCMVC